MIIGVDAGCLGIRDKRLKVGVYQMAKNLLIELGKIDHYNDYLLYSFYPIEKKLLLEFGRRMQNVLVRPSRGWMKIWLPLRLWKDKPDIFLALSQAVPSKPPFSRRPYTIGFIHDVAFERFPAMYSDSLFKLKKNTRELVENANFLISVSESSKKDVVEFYHVDPKKILVIYQGISADFRSKKRKHRPKTPYFLYVGALKGTKNVPNVIKAFSYFLENSQKDYKLLIVGGDKWFDKRIDAALNGVSKDVQEKIKFLGFVDDEDLPNLYRGATAFISPSLYEGFGLTFLEAMASSCPVIGSNRGSILEIVGDAGILIEPDDFKTIGKAMIKIANDKKIRNLYVKKGLKRATYFSWHKFSQTVLSIIEKTHGKEK